MANVQGTANYVYFPDQSLGVGASGTVFLGRHKVSSDDDKLDLI